MSTLLRIAALSLCTLSPCASIAQASPACPRIPFRSPGKAQVTAAIQRIEGEAIAAPETKPSMLGGVRHACLALFTQGGKRIAAASTDARGAFSLDDTGPGRYVLIARPPAPFAAVAVPLRLARGTPGAPARGVLLRLRTVSDDKSGTAEVIGNLPLRHELLEMERSDQAVRRDAIKAGITRMAPKLARRMQKIDSQHELRLHEILKQFGWPARDLVGVDGADAASTLIMHLSADTQKQALPLLEAAYRAGTARGDQYAMLLDHVRIDAGKPQVYGTVAKFQKGGKITFYPIEDEAHVDERRAQVGLPPLAEYRKMLKKFYFPAK